MTGEPHKRPTIHDVARVAGVSTGTVSRVLNSKKWVSPQSAAAVHAAVEETGYRVNPHARTLVNSRSNTIAFLVTESEQVIFKDPNFSVLTRGAAQALAEHDMSLVLIIAGDADEQRRATAYIRSGHVDGVLLAYTAGRDSLLVEELIATGVPVVSCGEPLGMAGRLGTVSADDRAGARAMTNYLKGVGRRRIATIAGPQDTPAGYGRLKGYRDALGDLFDERLVAYGDFTPAGGENAMVELLEGTPDLDAVFAANDVMADAALAVLRRAGRAVPSDVSVAGFDDSSVAELATPPLTTVHQHFDVISAELVRVLLEVVEGEVPRSVVIPTTLVVRESA